MKKQEQYIEIIFRDIESPEKLRGILSIFSPLGILEEEEYWSCYFVKDRWLEGVEADLTQMLRLEFPNPEFEQKEIEQENWNKNWEDTIVPQRITDRIIISPSWNHDTDPRIINIVIDPKMSFGTGYHPTTRIVIRLLEKHILGGETVLDVGTGTGVLAIAAVKLGARYAFGVDADEWSYENAKENIEKNELPDKIDIAHGSLEAVDGKFDVVLANITKADICSLLPHLLQHARDRSIFLFSGIPKDDKIEMEEEFYLYGLSVIDKLEEDEWIGFAVQRAT